MLAKNQGHPTLFVPGGDMTPTTCPLRLLTAFPREDCSIPSFTEHAVSSVGQFEGHENPSCRHHTSKNNSSRKPSPTAGRGVLRRGIGRCHEVRFKGH